MEQLRINPELVGTKVCNAARPDWGIGTVLHVQPARRDGGVVHRVSIQFSTGHRMLWVPPARLISPRPEPQRRAGWLDGLGKTTLDDQLRKLPDEVAQALGTPRERLAAVIPLYAVTTDSPALLRWASSQAGVSDPLTHWTRDELLLALRDFCNERDAYLRNVAALLKRDEGPQALRDALGTIPPALREPVLAALQRPI